jgi:Protein of unknown function (DUF5656)
MTSSLRPRYDRIVSLVLIVLIGLTVIFLIDINPNNFRARLGGDLPAITLSWVLIGSLVLITSTGADVFIRSHPEMQTRSLPTINLGFVRIELAFGFWVLPAFTIIAPFALFRLFSASLGTIAGSIAVIVSGALLFMVLIGQHYALDRQIKTRQIARTSLQTIALLVAFGVFSAATLIGLSSAMLAYALLQWSSKRGGLAILSAVVGITLAEVTWALNYWAAPFLLSGVVLLAMFHVVTGMLQSHLEGTLSRRVILEYSLIGSGLLAAVVVAAFR